MGQPSGEQIEFGEFDGDAKLDLGKDRGQLGIIGGRSVLARELAERLQLGAWQPTQQKAGPNFVEPIEECCAACGGAAAPGQSIGHLLED